MKTKILFIATVLFIVCTFNTARAESEKRDVPSFSEISLRISGTLHVKQGKTQSVEIIAKSSTLDDIITEVKGRQLIIQFPKKLYLMKSYKPGEIEINITVPEIDGLSVSGSGDINADEVNTRILDLAISGSGNINIDDLKTERLKVAVSGSGDVNIGDGGPADELIIAISGSGSYKGKGFEAQDVEVKIAGSGNCTVTANNMLKARIAGSGNVYYRGNPSIDTSVAGSGSVKKL